LVIFIKAYASPLISGGQLRADRVKSNDLFHTSRLRSVELGIVVIYCSAVRNRKVGLWIAAIVALQVLVGGGIAWAVNSRSKGSVDTPEAPTPTTSVSASGPPAPPAGADITGPLDLLLIGVDTRVSIKGWEPHADTVMLLHVTKDLKSAYLYSLPRDLRVKMPVFAKAGFRGGTFKLTEAMSRGSRSSASAEPSAALGYELLAKTLTSYTGIKEFQAGAILNFGGLAELTDQLGGIDVAIDQKVASRHRKPDGSMRPLARGGGDYTGPQAVYLPGKRHLVGWQAIDYARQRYGLPEGDYDRTRHQRQLVKALLAKALDQGLNNDPAKLENIVTALSEMLVYVGGRRPVEYAYALRDLTPAAVTLVNLPGAGVGRGGGYRGEQLTTESRDFLKAVARDQAAQYLASHPKLVNKS
jgi:polyisoprenyl-teichoic acid--peptidoglycan teichoic acid transferase